MPTHQFNFPNREGKRLSGSLEVPESTARGWAVFAHCLTCGKNSLAAVRISRALAAAGIGVLRFDFSGLGDSDGNFSQSTFNGDVEDIASAADAMKAGHMAPDLLIGHSLGGAAVLAAAAGIPSVRAVATIGAPFDVVHVLRLLDPEALAQLDTHERTEVPITGRGLSVGQAFVDAVREQDQGSRIAGLGRPLLLLHAPGDDVVGIDHATRIFLAARHPKSFVSLGDADHLLSRHGDAEHAARMIAAWADGYLPAPAAHRDEASDLFDSADAVAEETGLGKFQIELHAGGRRWIADEPEAVGGLGSGPTPYALLASALAACTTMTLRHYADSKGWEVRRIRTAVSHRREKGRSPPDVFSRQIAIEGQVDEAQRMTLAEVAQRCPVHRTLGQGARVEPVQILSEPS